MNKRNKLTKRGRVDISLDRLGDPIIDPAPDRPPTWEDTVPAKALFRGGNWGMFIGLIIAIYYISTPTHSPLGFYSGNLLLALAIGIGAGFVSGAFIGWAIAKITGKNKLPPTSLFDTD